jgi:hypothetical protein
MRWIVPICILIASCSHGQVQFSSGAASTASGGTVISSSSAGLNVQASGSSAAALIGLGIAGAVIYGSEASGTGRAPELAPVRKVNEQDCTRPIEDLSANLKCR